MTLHEVFPMPMYTKDIKLMGKYVLQYSYLLVQYVARVTFLSPLARKHFYAHLNIYIYMYKYIMILVTLACTYPFSMVLSLNQFPVHAYMYSLQHLHDQLLITVPT